MLLVLYFVILYLCLFSEDLSPVPNLMLVGAWGFPPHDYDYVGFGHIDTRIRCFISITYKYVAPIANARLRFDSREK